MLWQGGSDLAVVLFVSLGDSDLDDVLLLLLDGSDFAVVVFQTTCCCCGWEDLIWQSRGPGSGLGPTK